MVAVISVDTFLFLAFSDLTCHLENTGIGVFWLHCKGTELGSSNQEASPSAGKNTVEVLVPCHAWNCVATASSGGLDIFEVLGCHLLRQMSSQ